METVHKKLLDLKVDDPLGLGETTLRNYLKLLLLALWREEEDFSGKRPFGESGWKCDIYVPLIEEGYIDGMIDVEGYLEEVDEQAGDALVEQLIGEIFDESAQ